MIVKLINSDDIWIPSPRLFFNILDKAGLVVNSWDDAALIENKLNEELKKDHDGWSFNIKFSFNVKDGDEFVPCKVRIIHNKGDMGDNCSGCIIFAARRKHSDKIDLDFDYEFSKEDM